MMISIQPTLLALALASLLFDVGLGRDQLGAVRSSIDTCPEDTSRQYELLTDAATCSAAGCKQIMTKAACDAAGMVLYKNSKATAKDMGLIGSPAKCFGNPTAARAGAMFNTAISKNWMGYQGKADAVYPGKAGSPDNPLICDCPKTHEYELITDAATCSAAGCEQIMTKLGCDAAGMVLYKNPKAIGQDLGLEDYPAKCFGNPTATTPVAMFNLADPQRWMGYQGKADAVYPGKAGSIVNPLICSCPKTETCEALQAASNKYNDKCGSNTGGSTSGGSNSGGSNSGGSNSGGDSTSGGGGAGGDTPVNKLINDVTIQIDNNPEDPMVDLAGIYKLKDVEGWQKEGDCSAFKKDPAYLATELVKKLKDDLASIRL